jgi:3-deoxy-7-phosphoheptulonate synthase
VTLPSYRGDLVSPEFTAEARAADPDLLLRGYERAALTLNFVRALVGGGFAGLHHPEYWDLGFVKHAPLTDAYQGIVNSIGDALDFSRASAAVALPRGRRPTSTPATRDCTCSTNRRETRVIARQNCWYNLSTHMPWMGMRTAQHEHAHPARRRWPSAIRNSPPFSADFSL